MASAHGITSPWAAIAGTAYGIEGADNGLVHRNGPLWYFPFLVSAICGAFLLTRLPSWLGGLALVAWLVFGLTYSGPRLPWSVDTAGIGVLFILAGHLLKQKGAWVSDLLSRRVALLALPVLGGIVWGVVAVNGGTNVNAAVFGRFGGLFLLGAFAGTLGLILLSSHLPRTRLADAISRNTLTIFALHIYFVMAVSKLPHPAQGPLAVGSAMALALGITLVCLLIARPLDPLLRRWVLRR